jgi:hypothetical protein
MPPSLSTRFRRQIRSLHLASQSNSTLNVFSGARKPTVPWIVIEYRLGAAHMPLDLAMGAVYVAVAMNIVLIVIFILTN